jgi:hypothetical protein
MRMSTPRPIDLISFIGTSASAMTEAIERAQRGMDAWYSRQELTHLSTGASIFQFSTTAYRDGPQYVFIITAFDTRYGPV